MAETQPHAPGPMASGEHPQRPRVWLTVIVVSWALLLAASIGWAVSATEPTAREQTTVAQALPVVDRATAEVMTAATVDGLGVASFTPAERAAACSISVVRDGVRYQRTALVVVAPGTEQALLERVRSRLPASYGVSVRPGTVPRLTADAGFFVRITGAVLAPGQVHFVIDTGDCRPAGELPATAGVASGTDTTMGTPERGAAETALAGLGVAAQRWTGVRLACAPGEGAMTTVEAVGPDGSTPEALDTALRPPTGSEVIVTTRNLVAYRIDGVAVAVRVSEGRTVVTGTTLCR